MTADITKRCRGRWRGLLEHFGVDPRYLNGKNGPCPVCGGTDRFAFDDKEGRGTWTCRKCPSSSGSSTAAGDGFALLMNLKGWGFKEAASRVEEIVGKVAAQAPSSRDRSPKALRDAMNSAWNSGQAITPSDPAGLYLASRGIILEEYPTSLRFAPRHRYQDDNKGEPSFHPVMLAKVVGPDGMPATIHRTYLDRMGRKADVPTVRKIMKGAVPKGSAVRLASPAPIMGIAEGIETALSASIIWRVPVWAAVNANMLMSWQPPDGVQEVIVFGDNDTSFTGQSAAFALAHRLVTVCKIPTRVELPIDAGLDWNDVLQAERKAA